MATSRRLIGEELRDYLKAFDALSFLEVEQVLDRRGRPISLGAATLLKYQTDYDRVGDTYLGVDNVLATRVSTVWLGPIYPYGAFETMIFSDHEEIDDLQWRYRTLRSAEIGHRRAVRMAKAVLHRPVALARPHRHGHW